MRRKRLNDGDVAALKAKPKRYALPDPELRGHYVRVTPAGAASFWAVARDTKGKQHWKLIGAPPMKIDDARAKAQAVIRAIRSSTAVNGEVADAVTFEGVARRWYTRHVVKNELRSRKEIDRFLTKHIIPAFAGMDFIDVRRKHITALLDHLEDKHGARQADYALDIVGAICNWQATRDEDYSSPVIKGMRRHGLKKRSRILNDREIAELWRVADGAFGNFLKLALLTAQRKAKLQTMKWSDVSDGVWTIPMEAREKGTGETLVLPELALAVLKDQRKFSTNEYVFSGRYSGHMIAFGALKARLYEKLRIAPWVIHDLRRTARSLMAAAGVDTLIAELTLGHKQQGIAETYNRHGYVEEKGAALNKLAARVRDIVMPPPDNVAKLHKTA
jgi:integrase